MKRLCAALLVAFRLLEAAEPAAVQIEVPQVAQAPRLSDYLEERPGEHAIAIDNFRQREPRDGAPASRKTVAYLSYDDKNIYVIFVCKEDPTAVRAHISKREAVGADDLVGITLDTFHDRRHAYVFYSNPYGIQADGLATEGQPDDYSFDTVWKSEGQLTADGYAVLFAIPFRSLRFSTRPGSSWGIGLIRYIPTTNETAMWPHVTSKVEAYLPQLATMNSPYGVSPGRNIELIPYITGGSDRFWLNGAERHAGELRGGLDAKLTLPNGLTLDATVHPDFSQVESDEPQVTINQRYEVVFPERRPFFKDNASYFQTPEPLFFSRRIVDPQFGAKLTGKVGDWAVGALATDDQAEGNAALGVFRLQRYLGEGSAAGILATTRRTGSASNQVTAADARWKLGANWAFEGQLMHSDSTEAGRSSSGSGAFAKIHRSGRQFTYRGSYRWYTPDFQAELGYIPRTDIRQVNNAIGYKWWPETGRLSDFGPALFTRATYDHTGRLQDWSVNMPFFFDFKGPFSIATDSGQSYELYRGRGFRKHYNLLYASVDKWKQVSISGSVRGGTEINYYPRPGVAAFAGDSNDVQLTLVFRPSSRFKLEETLLRDRLSWHAVEVFTNTLLRSKASLQMTRQLSARLILDYSKLRADGRLLDLNAFRSVRADGMVTWMLNPSTALYAGYGEAREGLPISSRRFFIKFSYLIRL